MKFNRGMCKALHLGENYPMHQYVLGASLLKSGFAGKDLGVLVGTKLSVREQLCPCGKEGPQN